MWRNKDVSVEIFVVHGFDAWHCGEFFTYTRLFLRKFWPHTCSEQLLQTGHASPPYFLPLIPNPIAAHPLLFVCSISFNIFTATVHAVKCAMSLKFRMTL